MGREHALETEAFAYGATVLASGCDTVAPDCDVVVVGAVLLPEGF